MSIGNLWANNAIDYLLNRDTYFALHISDPGATGELSSELTGGSYARVLSTFSSAASREAANNAQVVFPNLPASIVTHVGVWTASSFGEIICSGAFPSALTVTDGDPLVIQIGDFAVSV